MKRFVVFSFIAALAGCSSTMHEAAQPCASPETVESYCGSHTCPTFDEDAAAVRQEGKEAVASGALYRYGIGTCGSLRVITTQTMGMSATYYDEHGHVVAMTGAADTPVCGDEHSWNVGTVPSCTIVTTEHGGMP